MSVESSTLLYDMKWVDKAREREREREVKRIRCDSGERPRPQGASLSFGRSTTAKQQRGWKIKGVDAKEGQSHDDYVSSSSSSSFSFACLLCGIVSL